MHTFSYTYQPNTNPANHRYGYQGEFAEKDRETRFNHLIENNFSNEYSNTSDPYSKTTTISKEEYAQALKKLGFSGSEISKRLESFGSSNAVEVTFIMTGTGYSLESKGVTVDEGRAESSVNTCAGEENTKNNSSSSSEESKPEPIISGLYNSSWKNLGYRLRNLDRAINGRTNKSGQATGAV